MNIAPDINNNEKGFFQKPFLDCENVEQALYTRDMKCRLTCFPYINFFTCIAALSVITVFTENQKNLNQLLTDNLKPRDASASKK